MSTLPSFTLKDGLCLARDAGYHGVELRIHDNYHVSLNRLYHCARDIRQYVDNHQLDISVFNTYYGVNDECAIDTLIRSCKRSGVKRFRVVMPLAGNAAVAYQAVDKAVIPSYKDHRRLDVIIQSVKVSLKKLEQKALKNGVTALVEIHWGTIMSSFTSAYHFMEDLDPRAIAITFDPANMVIEGKEDWEYGIELLHDRIENLHIKNAAWQEVNGDWKWKWSALNEGLVDWQEIYSHLDSYDYAGLSAMEDFRVPHHYDEALEHISQLRLEAIASVDKLTNVIAA
jgi:sugar phosphate isomerase/epimerase